MNMNPFLNQKDLKSFIEQFTNPLNTFQGIPNNLQKQIEETVTQAMPDFLKNQGFDPFQSQEQGDGRETATSNKPSSESKNYKLFETHDFVILRVPVKEKEDSQIKIFLNSHRANIKFDGSKESNLEVPLPYPVKPKQTKAEVKNGILEVQMIKRGPEPMTEISLENQS